LTTIKLADFTLTLICSPLLEQHKFDLCKPNQEINTSLIINEEESINRKILENYFRDNKIIQDTKYCKILSQGKLADAEYTYCIEKIFIKASFFSRSKPFTNCKCYIPLLLCIINSNA